MTKLTGNPMWGFDLVKPKSDFPRAQRKRVRFKGICTDAKALGVDRSSLYRVLTGEWKIPGLKKAYEKLQAQKGKRRSNTVAA